jgi:hypothetical protein
MSNESNIRNVGLADGELIARYATAENVESRIRDVARDEKAPLMSTYRGLISDFSTMFAGANFSKKVLDETGKGLKIVFKAKTTYKANSTASGDNKPYGRIFNKTVFMSVGVPGALVVDVDQGLPCHYGSPAIGEADFAVKGAINDRAGQISFLNRFSLRNGTYMTAAAMEMAHMYLEYFLLPRLNGRTTGLPLPRFSGADYKQDPASEEIAFLPGELAQSHSTNVLSVIYSALQAENVLTAAGFEPGVSRVFNKCGDLPATEVDEGEFFEAWHVLKHSAIGSSNSSQWDIEFLLLVIQNFPLHSVSDEGGLWRKVFGKVHLHPNACVVTSNFSPNTEGYHNINDTMIVTSAMTIQSVVGRAIFEMDQNNTKFMLPPNAVRSDVVSTLNMCRDVIVTSLHTSTKMHAGYWAELIGVDGVGDVWYDRHILKEQAMFLKSAFPFMPTYALDIVGERLGHYDYLEGSPQPLTFKGKYNVKVLTQDNQFYLEFDMQNGMYFDNGMFYMNPKVNYDDGIMACANFGAITGSHSAMEREVALVDGRTFSFGDTIGEIIWRDNMDVIPTPGDLTSVYPATVLLSMEDTEDWIREGSYEVSVGRYSAVLDQRGESRNRGSTRIDLVSKKSGREYPSIGSDRPIIEPKKYYLQHKRMGIKAANRLTQKLIAQDKKFREELELGPNVIPGNVDGQAFAESVAKDAVNKVRMVGEVRKAVEHCREQAYYKFTADDIDNWIDLKQELNIKDSFRLVSESNVMKEGTQDDKPVKMRYGPGDSARFWDRDVALTELQTLVAILNNSLSLIEEQVATALSTCCSFEQIEEAMGSVRCAANDVRNTMPELGGDSPYIRKGLVKAVPRFFNNVVIRGTSGERPELLTKATEPVRGESNAKRNTVSTEESGAKEHSSEIMRQGDELVAEATTSKGRSVADGDDVKVERSGGSTTGGLPVTKPTVRDATSASSKIDTSVEQEEENNSGGAKARTVKDDHSSEIASDNNSGVGAQE